MGNEATHQDVSSILLAALDAIGDGVQIIGFDWRYLYVNQAACRHGKRSREEVLGRTLVAVYPDIDQTPLYRMLQSCMGDRVARQFDNELVYPDGTRAVFQLRVEPCPQGIFVLSVDITEHRRLELQLQRAQKMDAIGRLASGVAHDFNNLLTAIQGFTLFALDTIGAAHVAARDLEEVLAALDRAGALTKHLLAFARDQPIAPRVVDVNVIVRSIDRLLGRLLGEQVQIVTTLVKPEAGDGRHDPWRTLIDPAACEQLLINLAVNARDAMPNGGRLTIETLHVTVDEPQALAGDRVISPGDYVVLAVSDEGVGMEPALVEQMFEPFFTTKPLGKGTGLGLTTCHGIVRQAGGHIWVYSQPGQGSTFKVYLPRVREAIDETPTVTARDEVRGGDETILLVEVDAQVRMVAERALTNAGYSVIAATGVLDASVVFERHRGVLHLLLTEVTMPGGNGYELALRARVRYPRSRVLYMSGHTETAISRRGVLPARVAMLPKPFTPAGLARRVREVLDEKPPAPEDVTSALAGDRPVVMVVDDDELFRRTLKRQLHNLGCEVVVAPDSRQAVDMATETRPAAILLDLNMPGVDGHTLLRQLPAAGVHASIIVMSGAGGVDDVIRALRAGAVDYLKKPWADDDLSSALRRALEVFRAFTNRAP